jgi:hypothetical protein
MRAPFGGFFRQSPRQACAGRSARSLAVMRREARVDVRMTAGELALVDELRGRRSRPEFLRTLVHRAGPLDDDSGPNHDEALRLLQADARAGRATSIVAYERAMRVRDRELHEPDDDLEALLRDSRP